MSQHKEFVPGLGWTSVRKLVLWTTFIALFAVLPALAADAAKKDPDDTYDQDSIIKDAADFFGSTTEGLAKVIEKAFKDNGRPNGYIKGEEAGGAVTVGLRYGNGTLQMKAGP